VPSPDDQSRAPARKPGADGASVRCGRHRWQARRYATLARPVPDPRARSPDGHGQPGQGAVGRALPGGADLRPGAGRALRPGTDAHRDLDLVRDSALHPHAAHRRGYQRDRRHAESVIGARGGLPPHAPVPAVDHRRGQHVARRGRHHREDGLYV
jgi:hypothetical protein